MGSLKDLWNSVDETVRKGLCIALSIIMVFSAGYIIGASTNTSKSEATEVVATTAAPETTTTAAPETTTAAPQTTTVAAPETTTAAAEETTVQAEATEIGEGAKQFTFTVVDANGSETVFLVNTDEETVGAALLKLDIIAGEEGAYGLYVKTVNGTTLDYDTDGMYWAFYENGAYASAGVDSTSLTDGASYSFKAEK